MQKNGCDGDCSGGDANDKVGGIVNNGSLGNCI